MKNYINEIVINFKEETKTDFEISLNLYVDFLCETFKIVNPPKLTFEETEHIGTYYHKTNEINLSKYKKYIYNNKVHTYEYVLLHEFCHFLQTIEGRISFTEDKIFFGNESIDSYKLLFMSQFDYRNLPWEKEANDFAEKWEPILIKKFGLIQEPIRTIQPFEWFVPAGFEKGVIKNYKIIKEKELKVNPKKKNSNENSFWALEKQKYNSKVSKYQ